MNSNRRITSDLRLVGLPQRTVERPPRRVEDLAEPFVAVEIRSKQPMVVIDQHRQAAVRVDHSSAVRAAASDIEAVAPEMTQLRLISSDYKEMRCLAVFADVA